MKPPQQLPTAARQPTVGWSASAFVATVLARLIRKGLALLGELDDDAVGHLRRLEGLLAAFWRVLDAADAGAIDAGQRPLQDLLDAAYSADDSLDDLEYALSVHADAAVAGSGEHGAGSSALSTPGTARKPRSPLRFLLCFSPPRHAGASSSSRIHGKSSKDKKSSVDLHGLGNAFELVAQAAYRCTSAYEHVLPLRNYATIVSAKAEDATPEAAHDQHDIFGREAEVEHILEKVRFSDDPHYRLGVGVIPVVGVEGVGKTALAHFVFHHEVTKAEFPVRMWVHVAGALQVRKELLVQMIHGAVAGDARDVNNIRELVQDELTGKRFLLVLDDVTNVSDIQWRDLMMLLQPASRRSMIMVTTRSQTVSTVTGTMAASTLSPLAFEDYWKMFKNSAFGSTDESEECTPLGDEWDDVQEDEEELSLTERIASELAKKMGGLPLPAMAIGRALYFRQGDEEHWKNVLEDKLWERRQDVGGISPALWLSYQHLDPRLKQCFAYSAVFPSEYVFRKDELVQMWIAQGLIYSDQAAACLEDVGADFFDQLVKRCFFQSNGSSRYVMNNSMLKLAYAVSANRTFMVTESSGEVPPEVRHLTIMTNNLSKLKRDLALQLSSSPGSDQHFLHRIRTILFFADFSNSDEFIEVLAEIFSVTKSVRVLGLACANITDLPCEIGLLKRLQYLDISGNRITDLPETLCQLYHLQFLDIQCNSADLHPPCDITKLIHMRHLHASELFLSNIPEIQNISHLQELKGFNANNSSHIDALRGMTQLRGTLHIGDLGRVDVSEIRKGILKGMQHLNTLGLSWRSSDDKINDISVDEDMLEFLQPHENLKELSITGYGGIKYPSWLLKIPCYLSNVTSVFLTDCINLNSFPPLHVLPCLEILEVKRMHSIKKVSIIPQRSEQNMFPKLKRLVFEDVLHCTEWSTGNSKASNTVFPCLFEIELRNCPNLRSFPDIPLTLTTMIIENVGLKTLPRLQDKRSSSPSSEDEEMATSKDGRWTSRLTTLQIHQCNMLSSLGSGLLQQQNLLRFLKVLSIKKCDNIISDLSDGFKDLIALRDLSLYDCPKLLVDKFHTSLRTLEISECFIAQGAWVDDYPFLFSLWTLKITGCSHVTTDQESRINEPLDWLNCLFNVYSLHLENTLLLRLSMFYKLHSLENLENDRSLSFFGDLLEVEWLEKLQTLSIRNCKELCELPENLCNLPSLEEICIENCPAIEALPANGLPASLKRLSISKCSARLTQRCLDDETDRPKVAKVSVVYIDGECISTQ